MQKKFTKRCIFGVQSPEDLTSPLLLRQPLGLIFFRGAFEQCQSLKEIHGLLNQAQALYANAPHAPLLGLDQEGGQVERLNARIFPGLLSPYTVGQVCKRQGSANFALQHYELLSAGLAALGFNFNFFPTLDAHLNPRNPIIGNRAFAEDAETIEALGRVAIQAQHAAGVQSVLKHYPGHGSGKVDSHLALPALTFSEQEEAPFAQLMREAPQGRLPWVMLAHGAYANLQQQRENYPASCDASVAHGRLRETLGFESLTVTDDLDMRGVLHAFGGDQLAACVAALNAGVDVLLFRGCGEREAALLDGLEAAYAAGRIDETRHAESVARIEAYQQSHLTPARSEASFNINEAAFFQRAEALHVEAMQTLFGDLRLPLGVKKVVLLQPEPNLLPHYAMDEALDGGFPARLKRRCDEKKLALQVLRFDEDESVPELVADAFVIAVIRLPHFGQRLMAQLNETKHKGAMLLNVGTPSALPGIVNLCGFRPLQQAAFCELLNKTNQ